MHPLVSEYRFIYPKLDIVVQKFFGKEKEFNFKKLDEIATEIALDAIDHGNVGMPWQWVGGFDEHAEDFARLLADIGFLLVKVNRTTPPQIYDPQMMGPINPSMWFAVHPMYAPGLCLLGITDFFCFALFLCCAHVTELSHQLELVYKRQKCHLLHRQRLYKNLVSAVQSCQSLNSYHRRYYQ